MYGGFFMELMKKHIHMERMKCKVNTQTTVEDDVNISDQKPDALHLIMDQGKLEFDEIRAMQDCAIVRGKLLYQIMYVSDEMDKKLCYMNGAISFDEKVHMDGLQSSDTISGKGEVEDLQVELINSRKVSIQGLLNLSFAVDQLYTKEVAVDVANQEDLQVQKKKLELSCIEVQKKDIFRMKHEIELPNGYPNIFQMVWKNSKITNLEWKLLDEKISLQGECSIFFLYEGEGEGNQIRWYETSSTFNGIIECQGCREGMISDIVVKVEQQEMEVRPDFDGEERVVGIDMVLDLDIKLYETQELDVITDVYGIAKEVTPVKEAETYKTILVKNTGKTKVIQNVKIHAGEQRILQICHVEGEVLIEKTEIASHKIEIFGVILMQMIYVTGMDETPYSSIKRTIPFTYALDAADINDECSYQIDAILEQLSATMLDGEEVEIKGVVACKGIVFGNNKADLVNEISIEDVDLEKRNGLPSIVAYIAKEDDTIWDVGKKYYVPINSIQEVNNLQTEQLKRGDKILIVKEIN